MVCIDFKTPSSSLEAKCGFDICSTNIFKRTGLGVGGYGVVMVAK